MKQTALITGASSGFGYEFAKLFAKDGYDLILVARDMPALQRVATELTTAYPIECTVIQIDLSQAGAAESVLKQLGSQEISVLVNNAGFGEAGPFSAMEVNRAEQMIATNVTALTSLSRVFLPQMLARKSGKILLVASIGSFMPGPNMAVYNATKAYVLSFSYALAEELEGSGVTVTALCPGPTKTGFAKQAHAESLPVFEEKSLAAAPAVAEAGYRGLMNGKRIVIPGFKNKLIAFLTRILSRKQFARIMIKIQTPKKFK